MIFTKFRKITKEYCNAFNIHISKRKCKKLHRNFNLWDADKDDNDVVVAQFLDTRDLETLQPFTINRIVTIPNIPICAFDCVTKSAPAPQVKPKLCQIKDNICSNYMAPTCVKQEQEGTNPMDTERKYLNSRINDVMYTLRDGLEKQFNLRACNQPKTYKELIDFIKNDKFKLDDKVTKRIDLQFEADDRYYGSVLDGIIWTAKPGPDFDGYTLATQALEIVKTNAKDVINTGDAYKGLAALNDFKAWTYTAPTTPATPAA